MTARQPRSAAYCSAASTSAAIRSHSAAASGFGAAPRISWTRLICAQRSAISRTIAARRRPLAVSHSATIHKNANVPSAFGGISGTGTLHDIGPPPTIVGAQTCTSASPSHQQSSVVRTFADHISGGFHKGLRDPSNAIEGR